MGHIEILRQAFGTRLLITIDEVAPLLGWHPQSIRNAISAKRWQIPTKKLGHKLCISIADLAVWLDGEQSEETDKATPVSKPRVATKIAPAPAKRGRGRPRKYPSLG